MKQRIVVWGLTLMLCAQLCACGTTGTTPTSDGSGTSSGSGSSGSATGGTDTTSGGSGFEFSGSLATLNINSNVGVGKSTTTTQTITNVIAVSPASSNVSCKTAAVDSTGAFQLSLDANKPWLFYFVDSHQTGSAMFVAHLASETLDTILPTSDTGSLDVGTVTVENGAAGGSISNSALLSGLGLTDAVATTLGAIDDIAQRYSNPDVDGNGTMDCSETGKNFGLDFHVRYDLTQNGNHLTIADLIDQDLSETATVATYTGTGVYVSYPSTFSSESTGTTTFVDSAVTTMEGGAIPANTATAAVTNNDYSSTHSFGPNITSTSELPSGTIRFAFGSNTLEFTHLITPSLANLTAPTGHIFPFLKLAKTDATCTSACTLANLSYRWMKKTTSGWELASLEEVTALVVRDGGNISIRVNNDSSRQVQITIPKSAVSGTITWAAANASLSGVTAAEFTAITTTQLCHMGISYDDQLGMRYFEGVNDASGTCL